MRPGEIVRIPNGRICRLEDLPYRAVTMPDDAPSIVTVAELFEAAGHPVPGDRLAFVFSLEYTNALVSIGPRQWLSCSFSRGTGYWQFANGGWVRIDKPINEDGTSVCDDNGQEVEGDWCIAYSATLSLGNDASRMPALDAWDNLPDEIKAVVR